MPHDLLPVTRIPRTGLPAHAIVVGDPARAALVAALLDGAEEVSYHREYRVFSGSWKGLPVTVASHGVGAPGAILLFQELADAGVHTFLRFGTAGAMKPGIGDGDLVIAEAAVRDDGVTHQLLPPEYPAVSSPEAVFALQRAAREAGAPHHRGIVWTRAAFQPGLLPLFPYGGAGLAAIEMELSALLVTASLRGLVAGVCWSWTVPTPTNSSTNRAPADTTPTGRSWRRASKEVPSYPFRRCGCWRSSCPDLRIRRPVQHGEPP